MAARRIDFPDQAPAPAHLLPQPPVQCPAALAAAELVERAVAEHALAEAALAEAHRALETHRGAAAEQLLADLAAGPIPDAPDETVHLARIETAARRVKTAAAAIDLAKVRQHEALTAARLAFSRQMRPVLVAALEVARAKLIEAITANETLRQLAVFGGQHDPQAPAPYEIAFPLPTRRKLEELEIAREALFDEPEPLADRIPLRVLITTMPYLAGELIGLPEHEARLWCLAMLAEAVRPEDVKRLGLGRMARFDRPQRVKLTRDFCASDGRLSPKDSIEVFDPVMAARVVNLGFGTVEGPADE
ncbi:MAG: hypothetical protein WAS21_20470 [Geminicoccaceae bacterium]